VLHLAGGVAFGVDVGDFFQLERAFEGDGVVDAAAEEEEVVGGVEDFGEFFALGGEGEAGVKAAVGAGVGRKVRGSRFEVRGGKGAGGGRAGCFGVLRLAPLAQDDKLV
jgi:hypothetical protein